MNFFFIFFLLLYLIASLQDLKRREVDNWLNLLIFFSGFLFLLEKSLRFGELQYIINFSILVCLGFLLAHLFYSSKIFAGGDCKLFFASMPLIVSISLLDSLYNLLFLILVMFTIGSIYGLFWILIISIKDFNKIKKDLVKGIKSWRIALGLIVLISIMGFVDKSFFIFSLFLLMVLVLYILSLAIEKNSLTRAIQTKDLREGDWVAENIVLGEKVIKYSFEGLSKKDISLLKKHKTTVRIKDGIPYAPVFLFTWIVFFYRGVFIDLFTQLFV